jgi:hypothetical protein
MPFAVIAVSILIVFVVATPSAASPSCMSKTEARQHFSSKHLYWHGPNHCWDATSTLRITQARKGQKNRRSHEVRRNIDQPKWRESMSEMRSDDETVQPAPPTPPINRWIDIEPATAPFDARWVDIVQTRLPSIIERQPGATVSPRVMMLACIIIVIGLTLATIEMLFRRTVV